MQGGLPAVQLRDRPCRSLRGCDCPASGHTSRCSLPQARKPPLRALRLPASTQSSESAVKLRRDARVGPFVLVQDVASHRVGRPEDRGRVRRHVKRAVHDEAAGVEPLDLAVLARAGAFQNPHGRRDVGGSVREWARCITGSRVPPLGHSLQQPHDRRSMPSVVKPSRKP